MPRSMRGGPRSPHSGEYSVLVFVAVVVRVVVLVLVHDYEYHLQSPLLIVREKTAMCHP